MGSYNYQEFVDKFSDKYGGLVQKIVDFMENRDISSLMGEDLYEYFGTKIALSKTQFYVRRNALIDYVNYTNDPDKDKIINRISQLSQVQLAKRIEENSSTYKSLDEVLDLLNEIVVDKNLHSADATPMQSIAILIWMGYSNGNIIEFKISDINNLDKLSDKYKKVLKTYAGLKYYRALPSGKVQNLVESDYLFRTANTNKLTEYDVKKLISRINSFVVEKNKVFTRSVLKKSAAFVDMYKKYKFDVSNDIIRDYFGKSKQIAEINKLIVEYKKWVEQL